MSTNLQHRALRSQPQSHEEADPPRFTSMIVPIDRTARDRESMEASEVVELLVDVQTTDVVPIAVTEPARSPWIAIAVTALTSALLVPILCLALFPVSVLAIACAPLAVLLYAGAMAVRPDDAQRKNAAKSEAVPVSRAA